MMLFNCDFSGIWDGQNITKKVKLKSLGASVKSVRYFTKKKNTRYQISEDGGMKNLGARRNLVLSY